MNNIFNIYVETEQKKKNHFKITYNSMINGLVLFFIFIPFIPKK